MKYKDHRNGQSAPKEKVIAFVASQMENFVSLAWYWKQRQLVGGHEMITDAVTKVRQNYPAEVAILDSWEDTYGSFYSGMASTFTVMLSQLQDSPHGVDKALRKFNMSVQTAQID